jgi:hypothetical protein
MGHKGRIWMQEEFSWTEMASRMANVYRRLVDGTR